MTSMIGRRASVFAQLLPPRGSYCHLGARYFKPIVVLAIFAIAATSLVAADGELGLASTTNNNTNTNMTQLHEREFISPQARVQLDCQRDKTVIRVNFTRPFNGILGAGNPETTKCKLIGSNGRYYELQVSHNATEECNARWDNATSSIANTLFIRFHQSLETGADISKNVLCRLSVGDLIVGRRPTSSFRPRQKPQRIVKAKRNQ
uniref:ZP domain-containing protein n=1 Tax=Aceria tosichella TaxID=561515 RepID=A0A6G1SLT6_9ACAR